MCMFCAALPMVAGITAVAQGEQRKKIQAMEARHQAALEHPATTEENRVRRSVEPACPQRSSVRLTPRRITQLGALAFVALLFGSGFYHTHFPG